MTGKRIVDPRLKALPRLAFGNNRTVVDRDINSYRDALKKVISSLDCFDSIGRSDEFASKSALIGVGNMRLIAYANTPLEVRVSSSQDLTLLIPIVGSNLSVVDSKEYRWCAGQSGVFLPRTDRHGECGLRSVVAADIDADVLSNTVNAMLGEQQQCDLRERLEKATLVSLDNGEVNFNDVLRKYFDIVDSCFENPALLERMGLDDALYRVFALMMCPDLFQLEGNKTRPLRHKERILIELCEFIRANLGKRHTLTELESRSALSSRTLQTAFLKRFGMTPSDWIMEQRLLEADRVIRNGQYESLSMLALDLGFNSGSHFSRAYKQRFGITPRSSAMNRVKGWSVAILYALAGDLGYVSWQLANL